jgi:hypothetical protein
LAGGLGGLVALIILLVCVRCCLRQRRRRKRPVLGSFESSTAFEFGTVSTAAESYAGGDAVEYAVPIQAVVGGSDEGRNAADAAGNPAEQLGRESSQQGQPCPPPPPPPMAFGERLPPTSGGEVLDHAISLTLVDAAGSEPEKPPPPRLPAAPKVAGVSKKMDGMRMAAFLMPPATTPKLGCGLPVQLSANKKRRWRRKSALGAPLAEYATTQCYGISGVPQVLVALWCGLVSGGGLFLEGIFRLAPDAAECAKVEKDLAKGRLEKGHPIVLGHLIKKFLRELPGGLLGAAPTQLIRECGEAAGGSTEGGGQAAATCSVEARTKLYAALGEPAADVLRWTLRIIDMAQECEEKSKMGLRNLALVFGPNLFGPADATASLNPLEELERVELATNALVRLAALLAATK